MKKKRLKRLDFDALIWAHFLDFLSQEENHEEVDGELVLKDGVEYPISQIPNRNPAQVSDELWLEILLMHLNHLMNN